MFIDDSHATTMVDAHPPSASAQIPGGSVDGSVDAMILALRDADRSMARALDLLGRLMPAGQIERHTGLPAESLLGLAARRPGWDARALTEAAATLRGLPRTAAAFAAGDLSWPEVHAIVSAIRRLDGPGRQAIDEVVATVLTDTDVDPDLLIERVHDEIARLRDDLVVARTDRRVDTSFLSIQPRLDGRGGSLYAEADAMAFATICEAVDIASARPIDADQDGSRARQRLDGLVRVCEASLAGTGGATRPRPRFLVTMDARDLDGAAAKLLWRARGRPGRLSSIETQTLLCDAEIQPIVFDAGRPIQVGDIIADVSAKARTALIARDRGCRFPGCSTPAAWTDAHHIKGRGPRTAGIDDLVLLCRRCHRRIHRHHWTITVHRDGRLAFRHRGTTYTSHPRAPALE